MILALKTQNEGQIAEIQNFNFNYSQITISYK